MKHLTAKRSIYSLLFTFCFTASLIGKDINVEQVLISSCIGVVSLLVLALFEQLSSLGNLQNISKALLGAGLAFFCSRWLFATLTPLAQNLSNEKAALLALSESLFCLICSSWGAIAVLTKGESAIASFPFLNFSSEASSQNKLLLDSSALQDPRIYDIASTGIFDKRLAIPQFVAVEINAISAQEDPTKPKLRRSGEIIRSLEELPHLQLELIEDDQSSNKDPLQRLLNLAQKLKADVLTSERYRLQPATSENVRIFNLHTLASAFKPLTQSGEIITIKVQRYGKEIKQGVGYLEDNTMVVINGGGEYLGKTIRAQVLSVKHTLSGRMIFCNALSDDADIEHDEEHDDIFNHKTESESSYL